MYQIEKTSIKKWVAFFILIVVVFTLFFIFCMEMIKENSPLQVMQEAIDYVRLTNSDEIVLLRWDKKLDAVSYELEIFEGDPSDLRADQSVTNAFYRNKKVFTSGKMLKLRMFRSYLDKEIFWRVRALDENENPVSAYTAPQLLQPEKQLVTRNAPLPVINSQGEKGAVLLYPVYAYIGNPDAVTFEVEVLGHYPENLLDHRPSIYRVYSRIEPLTDIYDEFPRIGTFYWRVRGMDEKGRPVGVWSEPQMITVNTDGYGEVAIYGDSISHGGGHISFSPNDLEYSYGHYLDFPTINLSESGNTSEDMVNRFERDVLPFRPRYLLIMGGTNSLRAGFGALTVIHDLSQIQEKCRAYHIVPILLTLPPINPSLIDKAFQEESSPEWQKDFEMVNNYIRSQPHIDTAAPFEWMTEISAELALDGLHGDCRMKQLIAEEINKKISIFMQ